MTSSQIKKEIHQYIDQADERFLKVVYGIMQYDKEEIIGYTSQGQPINSAALKKRVKAASKRVKQGHYIAQEDLEKEMQNW